MDDILYEVAIVGGSSAGLSAALTLGRSLRKVLVIDSCDPCNIQTPYSHNFITRDGSTPAEILEISKAQVLKYPNVNFVDGHAVKALANDEFFEIETGNGIRYTAEKIILCTGLRDKLPEIPGFAECWGISVLHCPYCHGYEVRERPTAIFANGEAAYHLGILINNWTSNITIITNGISELRFDEAQKLEERGIQINEKDVEKFIHINGQLEKIQFTDGTFFDITVVYVSIPFEQRSDLAEQLGCKISSHNHIDVDSEQRTSIPGVYAAGDCTAQARAISVAAASGTKAAFTANLDVVLKAEGIK